MSHRLSSASALNYLVELSVKRKKSEEWESRRNSEFREGGWREKRSRCEVHTHTHTLGPCNAHWEQIGFNRIWAPATCHWPPVAFRSAFSCYTYRRRERCVPRCRGCRRCRRCRRYPRLCGPQRGSKLTLYTVPYVSFFSGSELRGVWTGPSGKRTVTNGRVSVRVVRREFAGPVALRDAGDLVVATLAEPQLGGALVPVQHAL